MKKLKILFLFLCCGLFVSAQPDRWQQRVVYTMDIDFDVKKHQFDGSQRLIYINNSPDELDKVFYHLYFNAFQPNSMMAIRNQHLPDSDPRVKGRIDGLKSNEIGYLKIKSLYCNGQPVKFTEVGTILEVELSTPIGPRSTAIFEMEFEGQVPIQIRRSGRDNKEGIAYSMSQWYPKMCEYDYQGWHANPYVGREFHSVWGDFDVTLHIDKDYVVGATGYLQNAQEIGHGYEKPGTKVKKTKDKKLHWNFFAPNVIDFVWAADPDYIHVKKQAKNGPMMHFFYQDNKEYNENWENLPNVMDRVFAYASEHYGKYPYDVYSFIQAGDGGMEYPMATLITGHRVFPSLVGVSVHELLHSWYQMVLATNESLYAWIDEGFTCYASSEIMNQLKKEGLISGKYVENPHAGSIAGYTNFASSGYEEPLSIHADHFNSNSAYGVASYVKGEVFLHQLEYIIGEKAFAQGLHDYFDTWKFKHPNDNDFIRIMEKISDLELDWYREYWVNTTHTIDYRLTEVERVDGKGTKVLLSRVGLMPMPLDVVVTYNGDQKEVFNIPLRIMRGEKPQEFKDMKYTVAEDWPWTHPNYELVIPAGIDEIISIEIDPMRRMADVNPDNNNWSAQEGNNK